MCQNVEKKAKRQKKKFFINVKLLVTHMSTWIFDMPLSIGLML